MGALQILHEQGKIRALGISNGSVAQIQTAHAMLGNTLVAVQNRYSAIHRENGTAVQVCEQLGITFVPFGPLGGKETSASKQSDWLPFRELANDLGVSWQRLAIAWLLHHSPAILPIPGASRLTSVRNSAHAVDLHLDSAMLSRLDG